MPLSRRRFVHLLGAGSVASLLAPAVAARGLEGRARAMAGSAAGGLVRLDSNENPHGPDRAALGAIDDMMRGVHRYPDDVAAELRAAVARHHGIEVANVCLGCGSTDLIRATVQRYTGPTRALVTAVPTYESPAEDAKRAGAPVIAIPVRADLQLDLAAMADAARGAGVVYLCNPNNPTARVLGRDAVTGFVERVLRDTPGCTILVDEAYHEYVDDPGYASAAALALANPRVVVARTFSKVHGLAGLRVGYAVAHEETIAALAPFALDIGVNMLAAAAARASLEAGRIARERARNREAREFTSRFFTDAGYAPAPSAANFLMVDIRRDAKAFRAACKAEGVLIGRVFPPLVSHARVTFGTMDEMRRATRVFRRLLAAG